MGSPSEEPSRIPPGRGDHPPPRQRQGDGDGASGAGAGRSRQEALLRSLEAHDIAHQALESSSRDTIVLRAPEPFDGADFILRPEVLDRGPFKHNRKGRRSRW